MLEPLPVTSDFSVSGTIVVAADGEKHKASFFWQREQGEYKISLLGPLGIPIAKIEKGELQLMNEERSHELKSFMQEQLGFYIAPEALQHVLLGGKEEGVEMTEISYKCAYGYKVPYKVTLRLLEMGVVLDLRVSSWKM